MLTIINPERMTKETEAKLKNFFENQIKSTANPYWPKQTTYIFSDETEFKFQNNVFMRASKKDERSPRFEFIANRPAIDSGAFATVFEIAYTMKFAGTSLKFKPCGTKDGQKRVVKDQRHTARHPESVADKEYENANIAGHLHIKKPVFPNKIPGHSLLVMKKMPGRNLLDVINDKECLTLKQRLELSLALLNALKTQLIDKKLIHRDLGPDNWIINMSTTPISVNIIDYGLSIKTGTIENRAVGKPHYLPPECASFGSLTSQADIFVTGKVIALLWNMSIDFIHILPTDIGIFRLINHAANLPLATLFTGLTNLSQEDKEIISTTLAAMTHPNPKERISVEEAIESFQKTSFVSTKEAQASSSNSLLSSLSLFKPEADTPADEDPPVASSSSAI